MSYAITSGRFPLGVSIADVGHVLGTTPSTQGWITGIAHPDHAQIDDMVLCYRREALSSCLQTPARHVITTATFAPELRSDQVVWVVTSPRLAYAKLLEAFIQNEPDNAEHSKSHIHPSTYIDATARLGRGVRIGPYTIIDSDVNIADGVVIGSHCHVHARASIGLNGLLYDHITVGHDVSIGNAVTIKSGAVIGEHGFGFERDVKQWRFMPHIASVRIGDRVHIGSSTCIDRGMLSDTHIGDDVQLDNQIQVAHQVSIGAGTIIAARTAIAGSARIGRDCMIGGCVCIADHINITDKVTLMGACQVVADIKTSGQYASHLSAIPSYAWKRILCRLIKPITRSHNVS